MSWGPATVFIHERMPDSEVISGVVDRYSTTFRPSSSLSLPLPMPSLNINFSEIDNIDDDYSPSSTVTLVPPRSEDSRSLPPPFCSLTFPQCGNNPFGLQQGSLQRLGS
jgi:hypothetical protein